MAITWVGRVAATACTQAMKQAWNWAGSRLANTRLKVSCEGIPLARSRKVANHAALASPNAAMSSHVSAPQITAATAIVTMLINGCSLVRSTRGSSNAAKWASRDRSGVVAIAPSSARWRLSYRLNLDASALMDHDSVPPYVGS